MSIAAGLPTWNGLRKTLTDALAESITTFDDSGKANLTAELGGITNEADAWVAFQRLENALGQTTFRELIREKLQTAPRIAPPQIYERLWKLQIAGFLNLNLDRLATRAFAQVNAIEPLEFHGFQVENAVHVLKSSRPFIINLHGHHEDASTWVLTRSKLNALMGQKGYKEFLTTCLSATTVVLVGISADDIAVGSHLDRLLEVAPDAGAHFWITDRKDEETNRWAEKRQIRIIRYTSRDGDHSELDELFEDLRCYLPKDEDAPPVTIQRDLFEGDDIPRPDDLAGYEAEKIRELLNHRANAIFSSGRNSIYDDYERFSQEYDEAIYRAWYTSDQPGRNQLLGYRLEERVARGAFGTVYRATDSDGKTVAVKVLHEEVRRDPAMLQSFRRGVRSMRILSSTGVPGMVPYLDGSEIPAFVVMDWVDGPNLQEALEAGYIDQWPIRLKVVTQLAQILRKAHMLPERVLHRDLRPPNVMLKGYYADPDDFEVVVLDFDLSWHIGASEVSLVLGATATGYLAPEQLQPQRNVSTRHAAIDSFGLGMTLFRLVAGRDPLPTEHEHTGWKESVRSYCKAFPYPAWKSLPRRFARIILNSTRTKQASRWDLGQIEGELGRLCDVCSAPNEVNSSELLAEELTARAYPQGSYVWDDDRVAGCISLASGVTVRTVGDEPNAQIKLEVDWSGSGEHAHRRVGKWLPQAGAQVRQNLESAGWKVRAQNIATAQLHLSATIQNQQVTAQVGKIASSIEAAIDALRFD